MSTRAWHKCGCPSRSITRCCYFGLPGVTLSARNNLASLALCFAAIKSADTGDPQTPGAVRAL